MEAQDIHQIFNFYQILVINAVNQSLLMCIFHIYLNSRVLLKLNLSIKNAYLIDVIPAFNLFSVAIPVEQELLHDDLS